MSGVYKLVSKEAVPCELMEWATSFNAKDRHVALTMVGNIKISTVFLGLDYQFGSGKPLLFETMVFGGPLDQEMNRYTTWEQAELGHAQMVKAVIESLHGRRAWKVWSYIQQHIKKRWTLRN